MYNNQIALSLLRVTVQAIERSIKITDQIMREARC